MVAFSAKRNLSVAQIHSAEIAGAEDISGYVGIGLNKMVAPGYLTFPYARGTVSFRNR